MMGVPEYTEAQTNLMQKAYVASWPEVRVNPVVQGHGESRANVPWSEAELGRADEPLVCVPTAELAGNTGTTLGEFFFWGQNVEDDGAPDYLAITRDVVGG